MDYIQPSKVVETMISAGAAKGRLKVRDLLIRGFLSGSILGFATSLAITGAIQTGVPLVGALIFPVGFVIIVLLGLELVTGSFALLPVARSDGKVGWDGLVKNWSWVFLGNLIGSLAYAGLLWIALTNMGQIDGGAITAKIVAIAEAKTIGYKSFGVAGMVTVFVKAILCNWMVCLGVVMAMTSTSTISKICASWLPIFIFFAQGFEHSVVNMFVIPAGMIMGADVSMGDWWLWNQIPVTLGNILGGMVFTGLFLYWTHRPAAAPEPVAAHLPPVKPQPETALGAA